MYLYQLMIQKGMHIYILQSNVYIYVNGNKERNENNKIITDQ